VGLLKKDYLHYSRSPLEMDLMRSIKKAFDPNSILNPGKLFD
jgi:FAD/FMN-containing dehydrogenase